MENSYCSQSVVSKAKFKRVNYDLMELIIVCIGDNHEDKNYGGIIRLIDTLLSSNIKSDDKKTILANDYGIKMAKTTEGEVTDMCNIGDLVYNRGRNDGIKEGREEGKILGAIELCKSLGFSLIDTVKSIGKSFAITEEDAEMAVRKNW